MRKRNRLQREKLISQLKKELLNEDGYIDLSGIYFGDRVVRANDWKADYIGQNDHTADTIDQSFHTANEVLEGGHKKKEV